MVYETAGLIALLVILVIYVRLRKRNNKPEDNGLEAQAVELKQIRKQLQQANNLFATCVVQLLAKYKQIKAELHVATSENESLKQTVQKLQQQVASVESERNEAREASTKLRLENTLLEQKVEQLESHKKVLIQELGGSFSVQDIEFITWEFLIQKVKEFTNQLNEVIARNQSLIQTNRDLQQEREILRRELNQVKDNNSILTQEKLQLKANKNSLESELGQRLEQIKILEKAKNKIEQEKAHYDVRRIQNEGGNATDKNDELLKKISRLNQIITQLEERIKQLEQKPNDGSSEQEQEYSSRYYKHPGRLDKIDLLEIYNDLVYFVQTSLNCSGIEELEDWEETEDFYVELISRLCFINTILVTKIRVLEDKFYFISDDLDMKYSYPGKFLFWSSGELQWELRFLLNIKL